MLVSSVKSCWHASLTPCAISSFESILSSCSVGSFMLPFMNIILSLPHVPLPRQTDLISMPASWMDFRQLAGLPEKNLIPIGSTSILILFFDILLYLFFNEFFEICAGFH